MLSVFVFSQLNGRMSGAEVAVASYSGSKMAAGRYQRATQQFTAALQGGGLGTWLRKPPELSRFDAELGGLTSSSVGT